MFKLTKKETIDQSSLYTVPLIAIGCFPNICIYFIFINWKKSSFSNLYYFYRASFIYFWVIRANCKSNTANNYCTWVSIGFRAGVWNIGAEGQFTIGALFGGATILAFYPTSGIWILPLSFFIAIIGGILWGMIQIF